MSKETQHKLATDIKNKYENCSIYINDEEPYTLYCANDIAAILDIKNIRTMIKSFDITEKHKIHSLTCGGGQETTYLSYTGLLKLLFKSKKPNVEIFCRTFNIVKKDLSKATNVIKSIMQAFKKNIMHQQYNIGCYFVDLYFEDYKLVVECNREHSNAMHEEDREYRIKSRAGCWFIRFDPYDEKFNIFELINEIYDHITDLDAYQSFRAHDEVLTIINDNGLSNLLENLEYTLPIHRTNIVHAVYLSIP